MARRHLLRPQGGAALLVFLVLLVMGALTVAVNRLTPDTVEAARARQTAEALAQAKEALIAHAAAVDLSSSSKRPGDLPCPDTNNDGNGESSCGNPAGTTSQANRLGRLPWKSLGLPDLSDGSGERLWYAVSNNFKENFRTPMLNSETLGTVTVRNGNGTLLHDASSGGGVVAVIIAPGAPLRRIDDLAQNRSAANINDPKHYLDKISTEDNADFNEIAPNQSNGFFSGPVREADGTVIANDRILVILKDEITRAIAARVLDAVRGADNSNGLRRYYALNGTLPWAAATPGGNQSSNLASGWLPAAELVYPGSTFLLSPPPSTNRNDWLKLVRYERLSHNAAKLSIPSAGGTWYEYAF